jgi:hypothetical protein
MIVVLLLLLLLTGLVAADGTQEVLPLWASATILALSIEVIIVTTLLGCVLFYHIRRANTPAHVSTNTYTPV